MPYKLEELEGKYYVVNKVTGKRHSQKPLSKARAIAQMRALYAAETAEKEAHNGAMVALFIPEKVASRLALAPESMTDAEVTPAQDLHITLAYLGEVSDQTLDDTAVLDALTAFGSKYEPITGKINGLGRFDSDDENKSAFWASFDAPGLAELRAALVADLESAGVKIEKNHGFTPHITLAYAPKADPLPEIQTDGLEFSIPEITLAWGDDRTSIRLGENPDKETGFTIMKQADGRYRWVLLSSNAFRDKAGEIVSTKALEGDVDLTDRLGDYGPLRWWHLGGYTYTNAKDYTTYTAGDGVDIGDCDFRMVTGKVLVESGTFRDEAVGEALAPIADQLQASIKFAHPSNEPDEDGVFTHIKSFERSLLPKGRACNRFTKFFVEKETDMTTVKEKIQAFTALLKDDNLVDAILKQAETVEKEAEKQGIASKETPEDSDGIAAWDGRDWSLVDEKAKSTDPDDYLIVEKGENGADVLHLQVKKGGKPDPKLMGAAHAALTSAKGFRGQPYQGPDKEKAVTRLKALYEAENLDWPEEETGEKEFSSGDVSSALWEALHAAFPNGSVGVDDWFPSGIVVYCDWNTGKKWADGFSLDEETGVVTLANQPKPVKKHSVYIPDGEELSTGPKVDVGAIMTGMKELRDLIETNVTQKDDTIAAVKDAQSAQAKRIAELEAQLATTQKELDELRGGQPRAVKELQALRASQSTETVIPGTPPVNAKENVGPHVDPTFLDFATGQSQ